MDDKIQHEKQPIAKRIKSYIWPDVSSVLNNVISVNKENKTFDRTTLRIRKPMLLFTNTYILRININQWNLLAGLYNLFKE